MLISGCSLSFTVIGKDRFRRRGFPLGWQAEIAFADTSPYLAKHESERLPRRVPDHRF
jgi:hypothetical protein